MRKKLQIIGFSLLALYAVVMALWMPVTMENFNCIGMKVNILDSADYRFVKSLDIVKNMNSAKLNPHGLSYKNISTNDVEKKVAQMPFVENAQCYKSPGGFLCIDVIQRKPILRVKTPDMDLYIDSEGKEMNVSNSFSAYVPVLVSERKLTSKYLKSHVYEFANYVYNDRFLNALVEQIYIDASGTVELVPRVGNHIVVLGTTDDYEKKLARLRKLYEEGFSKVGWNKYKKIDLTYANQAVCTRN